MRPEPHQQGFALVAAMFLIVVIAAVIATMARLSTVQHETNSLSIQQARAYQAARAGLEWGVALATANVCVNDGLPNLAGSNLAEFTVTVTMNCPVDSYTDETGATVQIYRITVVTQNGTPGGRSDYAFRSLSAVVER